MTLNIAETTIFEVCGRKLHAFI